jgi:hypothetical protein
VAEAAFVADPEITAAAEPPAAEIAAPAEADADITTETARSDDAGGNDAGDVAARLGALISSGPASGDEADAAVELAADGAAVSPAWDLDAEAPEAATPLAGAEEVTATDEVLLADEAPVPVETDDDLVAAAAEPEAEAVSLSGDRDDDLGAQADHPVETDFTAEDVALLAQLDGTVFDEESLAAALDDTLPEDQPVAMDLTEAALQDPLPEASRPIFGRRAARRPGRRAAEPEPPPRP